MKLATTPSVSQLYSLREKVAVVTGAAGLLGHQHCHALAEAGAVVVAADLCEEPCRQMVRQLPGPAERKGFSQKLDVTSPKSIRTLREAVLRRYGRIDVLVNNAGINEMVEKKAKSPKNMRFERYSLSRWRAAFDVNVTGVFLCSQILGSVMVAQKSGSIINIASTYGMVAPDQTLYRLADGSQLFYKSPAYPATKGAVLAFTRYLAAYWAETGVRVNALSPGGVENSQDPHFIKAYSGRTPLRRMARPWEYRAAIVFLAAEASSYMTGANLVVDGGWTVW